MSTFLTRYFVQITSYLREREEGATAVEYGVMVALIAAVIIGTVTALGDQLVIVFDKVTGALSGI